MGDTIDLRSIGRFDGMNFQAWKFQMKAIFIANGLTDVVNGVLKREGATTDEQRTQWDKKNAKAMVIISSTMETAQLEFLLTCETAAEMWNKLSAVHELKSESNKLLLMTRFHEYRMTPGDGVAQHVAKVENMARHLNDIGETVSNVTIMAKILGSLPAKYNAFVTAWDSVESENQTLDKLRERLIKEEARMNVTDEATSALAAMNSKSSKTRPRATETKTERSKKEIECFYCHKLGHYIKDCRKKKRDEERGIRSKEKQKNNGSSTEAAFSAEVTEKEILNMEMKDVWILDSGASRHMTYRADWISNLQTYEDEHVSLGDGTKCKVRGRGTVYIKRLIDDQWLDGVLEDVLYVPDLNKNLFSVGACMNKNYRVVFKDNSVKLFLNDALKASGAKRNNNLFHMFFKVRSGNDACVATTTDIKRWHDRLGHVNYKYVRQMCKQGLIVDSTIDNAKETEDLFCEACQYGKQHRLPFKPTTRDKPLPGELIHSDVCGKMSQESVGGSNYFVSFKDDCTAYRMVFFIKHKSDVLDKLKEFVNLVENKFQRCVKTLRVDNGREYCNEQTMRFLHAKGINIETTAPFTPEQNGRAERDNRTLVESARAMLHAKDLPVKLWAEAVNTACHILNRTPTVSNRGMTPYEAWMNRKPHLDHIRVFGSEAYAHIPKQLRKKWDKKAQKLLLVGYQGDSCNYRLYNPRTGKIIVSRDVVVHETSDHRQEDPDKESEISAGMTPCVLKDDSPDTELSRHTGVDQDNKNGDQLDQSLDENEARTLRDRGKLKPPTWFQANLVEYDEPTTYEEAVSGINAVNWTKAIDEELKAHTSNGTWSYEDLPEGKKTIGSKWVFKRKHTADNDSTHYKARLCAKGFSQKQGIDYEEVFSPVARYDSIRTMLALAALNNMEIGQFDVKTAFLNGELMEEIYMEIPKGVTLDNGKVCKLRKSLYGLKQASRTWNCKFDSFLKRFQFVPSKADACVYTGNFKSSKVHLIIYVDDGLILASSNEALKEVMNELESNFRITIGDARNYVGIEIIRDTTNKSIYIHQASYTKRILQRFNMTHSKPKSTPADLGINLSSTHERDNDLSDLPYRQAIGSLMFLSNVTRPDIAFVVNYLSRFMTSFNEEHWRSVKNVFRYLRGTIDMGILYEGTCNDVQLKGFSDSDYAGDLDTRRSTTGYLFTLANGGITWGSLRQRTVSLSTTEAEYIAICEATKETIWLKQLLSDGGYQCDEAIIIKVDNQSAIKLVRNPEYHKRSKHIDIRYHFVRERYSEGDIDVEYVCSRDQLADILTKVLSRDLFQNLRAKIGVVCKN